MKQTGSMLFVAAVFFFAFLGCGEKKETELENRTEAKKTSEKGKEEKHEGEKKGEQKHAEEKERVKLSPEALKNAGIKTAAAKADAIAETLSVTATIAHNQDRLFHVTPRITGRVVDVRVSCWQRGQSGDGSGDVGQHRTRPDQIGIYQEPNASRAGEGNLRKREEPVRSKNSRKKGCAGG